MQEEIYHEKQTKWLCALHALNNLLQNSKAFTQEDLDTICYELDPDSWVNRTMAVLGLGYYDINVIMTALRQKQLETIWFDKRKDPSEELNFDNIYGFILNIPSDCKLGPITLPTKGKHWLTIRDVPSTTEVNVRQSNYYNLDSNLEEPECIGITENLIQYLRGQLETPEVQLFVVVTKDVEESQTWRKNGSLTSLLTPATPNSTTVTSERSFDFVQK